MEAQRMLLWFSEFSNPGQITYITYVSSGDGGCGGEFTARFLFPQFILIIIEVLPKNDKP